MSQSRGCLALELLVRLGHTDDHIDISTNGVGYDETFLTS